MLCIELTRNGTRLATAGLPGNGVITLMFSRVLSDARGPGEIRDFSLSGLDSSTAPQQSLSWCRGAVGVGDEFVVRFVEQPLADAPAHREPSIPRTAEEARVAHMEHLAFLESEARELRAKLGLLPLRSSSGSALRHNGRPVLRLACMAPKKEHRLDELFQVRAELTVPTSVRFSASLLKRIDALAEAKRITRTEAIEKLLAWALDELSPEAGETLDELQARRRRSGGRGRR